MSLRSCTVVICTRDRPAALEACLAAVHEVDYRDVDVLVVDNGRPESGVAAIAARWGARCARELRPGLSRARNRGAREARGDLVAYLDDDAVPERGWLIGLAREFADPDVMAVAGRIRPSRLETAAECLFEAAGGFTPNRGVRRQVDAATPGWFELTNFGGVGTGANMAFRRCAFDRWPGFDERLGVGAAIPSGEEHNAFFALVDLGYRVVYSPDAVVRHAYPQTLAELRERHVKTVAASAGYLMQLLADAPRHRRTAVAAALRMVWGRVALDESAADERHLLGPRHRVVLAAAAGALGYTWLRWTGRSTPAPPPGARLATAPPLGVEG
jgi:GT2 family glycosyltransferase